MATALKTLAYFYVAAFMMEAKSGTVVNFDRITSNPIVATSAPLSTSRDAMENVMRMEDNGFAPPAMDTATQRPRNTKTTPHPNARIVKFNTLLLSFVRIDDDKSKQNVPKIMLANAARHGENHMTYAAKHSSPMSDAHPIASRYLISSDGDHHAPVREHSARTP